MSPDGQSVDVANTSGNSISQYDVAAGGTLSPKSPPTVAAGGQPTDVLVSPAARVPTSKRQNKHGGWKQFSFKNQGRCVAFVNRGPKG